MAVASGSAGSINPTDTRGRLQSRDVGVNTGCEGPTTDPLPSESPPPETNCVDTNFVVLQGMGVSRFDQAMKEHFVGRKVTLRKLVREGVFQEEIISDQQDISAFDLVTGLKSTISGKVRFRVTLSNRDPVSKDELASDGTLPLKAFVSTEASHSGTCRIQLYSAFLVKRGIVHENAKYLNLKPDGIIQTETVGCQAETAKKKRVIPVDATVTLEFSEELRSLLQPASVGTSASLGRERVTNVITDGTAASSNADGNAQTYPPSGSDLGPWNDSGDTSGTQQGWTAYQWSEYQ
ncbi:hypothetical protein IAT40_003288 [Kwoniella sp. CBS 6097]